MRDEMGPSWTEVLNVLEETGRSVWEMKEGVAVRDDTEDIMNGIAQIMLDHTAAKIEEVDEMQVE